MPSPEFKLIFKKNLNPETIERIQNWIKALRSGKYTQAAGALRSQEAHYCCLGVACDQSNLGEWNSDMSNDHIYYVLFGKTFQGKHWAELPQAVQDYYGMNTLTGSFTNSKGTAYSLANLNDEGADFLEIADILESQLQLAIEGSSHA